MINAIASDDIKLLQPEFYKSSRLAQPADLFGMMLSVMGLTFACVVLFFILLRLDIISHSFRILHIENLSIWYTIEIVGYLINVGHAMCIILNCWLTMAVTRIFKIRCPGLALCLSFLAASIGYLAFWELIKLQRGSPLNLFIYMYNTMIPKPANNPYWFEIFYTFLLYPIFVASPTLVQTTRPFNEEKNRWFKTRALPPIFVKSKDYEDISNMFKRGKIGRFIRYGQFKKSNLFRFYLDRFIGFGFRIYIDYDPEKQECYITVLGRKAMRLFVLHDHIIRNWKVSRDMAKALLNKISYG